MHNHRSIYGNMVQEYAVSRIRELNENRTARIDALQNREDAEKYVSEVRAKVQSCFPMPADRSVPASELCGIVERENFTVEKIIYYSREKFPVTANLYLPKSEGKHPAVLFVCGHSGDGKACDTYQRGAQNLVLQGYVVLLIDPISQGERWQFLDVPYAQGISGLCTSEHTMQGKQLRLCGDYLGAWRAYDALRGLDYLLSRREVDPARVGITGNSGGGTGAGCKIYAQKWYSAQLWHSICDTMERCRCKAYGYMCVSTCSGLRPKRRAGVTKGFFIYLSLG